MKWFIIAAHHAGEQPGVLEHEAPEGRGLEYASSVTAIPKTTRYVPQLEHPQNRIIGDQTAIVTGPAGEEIYPDQHGRVKVQFHWDREGQWNEKTSCWIRVSQGWAGSQYGTMAIPRIGHEVVVSFLNGDPDRPIITGRVYHGLNQPPYALPEHKTRTVFKSMSTPGKENEKRGFNELRIEDKAGAEEIYVHAEKDVNIHVKNDWKDQICNDHHLTVENFQYSKIKLEKHTTVEGNRKTLVETQDHLTVRGDSHTQIGRKWLVKTGDEIHLESLMKAVLEAGADLTLKVGPSSVRLVGGNIYVDGPSVVIDGGGSLGAGTPANPLLPTGVVAPLVPPNPSISCLARACRNAACVCETCTVE